MRETGLVRLQTLHTQRHPNGIMGWVNHARRELAAGRIARVRPMGGSMRGRIESGQLVAIAPARGADAAVGDAVLVKWRGGALLHLVKERRGDRLLIGNNLGRMNGWVDESAVLGKVVAVGAEADEEAGPLKPG